MAEFVKLIDWRAFQRRNLNKEVLVSEFAYADKKLVILWLLRTDSKLTIADDLEILNQDSELRKYKYRVWPKGNTASRTRIC